MHAHWNKLGESLLFAFPYISHRDAPKTCIWHPDLDIESVGTNYRKAESPYVQQIEQAIDVFCRTGQAPTTSPEASYFLGIRSAVVESFLMQLGSRSDDDIRTVFLLPPDMSIHDAARWLFTYWWKCQGATRATYMRIIDDFYKL